MAALVEHQFFFSNQSFVILVFTLPLASLFRPVEVGYHTLHYSSITVQLLFFLSNIYPFRLIFLVTIQYFTSLSNISPLCPIVLLTIQYFPSSSNLQYLCPVFPLSIQHFPSLLLNQFPCSPYFAQIVPLLPILSHSEFFFIWVLPKTTMINAHLY